MNESPSRSMLLAMLLLAAGAASAGGSIESVGKARYLEDCAFCHGDGGKGNGPFAILLKRDPPDLTALAKANGGHFPFEKVYESIDGRSRPLAHGGDEMPIWGQEWRAQGGVRSETELHGRVLEVMMYLRAIQAP